MRKLICVALGACLASTALHAQKQWTLQELPAENRRIRANLSSF